MVKREHLTPQHRQHAQETTQRHSRTFPILGMIHNLKHRRSPQEIPHRDFQLRDVGNESFLKEGDIRGAKDTIREIHLGLLQLRTGKNKSDDIPLLIRSLQSLGDSLYRVAQLLRASRKGTQEIREKFVELLVELERTAQSDFQAVLQIDRSVLQPYLDEFKIDQYIKKKDQHRTTVYLQKLIEAYTVVLARSPTEGISTFSESNYADLNSLKILSQADNPQLFIRSLALYDLACFILGDRPRPDFERRYLEQPRGIHNKLRQFLETKLLNKIHANFVMALHPSQYKRPKVLHNPTQNIAIIWDCLDRLETISIWQKSRNLKISFQQFSHLITLIDDPELIDLEPTLRKMVAQRIEKLLVA